MWNQPDKYLSDRPRGEWGGHHRILFITQKPKRIKWGVIGHDNILGNHKGKLLPHQARPTVRCPPVAQSCSRSLSATLKRDIIGQLVAPAGQIPNVFQ